MRFVRVLIVGLLTGMLCAPALPATARAASPVSDVVVVVLAPYLTWDDMSPARTPTLWKLASEGAVADVNAHSRAVNVGGRPTPIEGPLTLSAGYWAPPDPGALAAFEASETVGNGTAADAYAGIFGEPMGDAEIAYLGLPATRNFEKNRGVESSLGALGQAVVDAGGETVAIGNSDLGIGGDAVRLAPLAAMDASGRVDAGAVSEGLLRRDAASPFGVRTDLAAFERALERVDANKLPRRVGRRLVVLDPGDGLRAARFAPFAVPRAQERQRRAAARTVDAVAAAALRSLPRGATLILTSQSLDGSAGVPESLGPMIVYRNGLHGYLTSASTHKVGLVTQLDVTATIFDFMGLERPVSVLGSSMRPVATSDSIEERVGALRSLNATAKAIDTWRAPVLNVFITLTVLTLLFGAIVIVRWHRWRPAAVQLARTVVMVLVLLVLAFPPAAWLMFVGVRYPATPASALGMVLSWTVVILALGLAAWRFLPMRMPVALVSLGTAGLFLIDQWLGYPLSLVNYLGYSPLLGARFYGIGNEAAALLFGATVMGTALVLDQWPASRATRVARRWLFPLAALVVTFTAAAPRFGANVGVAVWATFGFALAWWLYNGHRVTWRLLVVVAALVVMLVGLLAVLDLTGATQTHLGRAISSAQQGGIVELWKIVARKAATNIRVFTKTNYSYILIAVLAYLAFMRWRPSGEFGETLRENRYTAQGITVTLAAGALAFFTEDSGIVIPALISLYLGASIEWLMLSRLHPEHAEGVAPERIAPDESPGFPAEGVAS